MGNSLPSLAHEAIKATLLSEGIRTKLQFLKLVLFQLNQSKRHKQSFEMCTRCALKSKAIPEEQENYDGQKKGAIRVKVVLTKMEAAQLLAMYVRGDQEKVIAKVVDELGRVDAHGRMSTSFWTPSLLSIPED